MAGGSTLSATITQLEANGIGTVIGTVVNPAGLTLAKTVPIRRRTPSFVDPVWEQIRPGTASWAGPRRLHRGDPAWSATSESGSTRMPCAPSETDWPGPPDRFFDQERADRRMLSGRSEAGRGRAG